jgi:23S rRNA (adenine2503-C2)-methyltransferase
MAAQVYMMGKEKINNIVMMGMGEPLDNYAASVKFIKIITSPEGYGVSGRNVTLSTCGLIGGIRKLMREGLKITLAVSLHAPNDEIRRRIIPAAKGNPYGELVNVCREYAEVTGRRVTFEYALIKGLNDADSHARELGRALKGGLFHINVIPLNRVRHGLEGADAPSAARFADLVGKAGVSATVRESRGADINGACGQLKLSYNGSGEKP